MKITNNLILNNWYDYSYKIASHNITDTYIRTAFSLFRTQVLSSLSVYKPVNYPSSIKLLILFKVKTINNQYRTIGPLQIVDINDDLQSLSELFIKFWSLRSEEYFLAPHSDIVFTYKLIDSNNLETKILTPEKLNKNQKQLTDSLGYTTFGGYNLPNNMDFTTWGDCQFLDFNNAIVYKKSSQLEYHIKLYDYHQIVDVMFDDKLLLTFKDEMNDKTDLSSFTRSVKKHEYTYQEGKLILKKIEKRVQFLKKTRKSSYLSNNFITMDLETRVIDEVMTSYCVSIYDGKTFKSFYLSDYSGPASEKDMLRDSIKYLMKRKYHNHKIYLHNFSRFDAVFLLTVMTDLSDKVFPVIRDGRFIDLRFNFADKYNLYFRDSLLLLPAPLRSLAKNFSLSGVEDKGLFPYRFVNNKIIPLDYKGECLI